MSQSRIRTACCCVWCNHSTTEPQQRLYSTVVMTAIYSGLCTWPCTSLPRFLYIWLAICTNNMVKLLYTSCWSRDRQHLCSAAHHQLTIHHLIMYCILSHWPSDLQCSVRSVAWPLTQHGNHYTYAVQWLPVRRWVDFISRWQHSGLVYLSLSGIAPAYLATDS